MTAVAARWWKAQVNLNAKAPAFAAALPELTHDELAGWGQGGDVTRQTMSLVLLRHAGEGPRAAGLFDAVRAATDEVMADVLEVRAEGDDDLSRFFDLALLGELVSLAPGRPRRRRPGPVPAVDEAHDAGADAAASARCERLAQALHDHGHALAAADAHRLEAERLARVLEPVEQRGHDAGAGLAERVAEGDGAALDVELVPADAEVLGRGDRPGRRRPR